MDFTKLTFNQNEESETGIEKETVADKKLFKLLMELEKVKKKQRDRNFQEWLNFNLSEYMHIDSRQFKIKHVLNDLIETIMIKLDSYNYKIKDKKAFRNEVASFIYNL